MDELTHDAERGAAAGFGWAVFSAASFGTSGALAGGLMDAGWTPAGAVVVRISIASLVLLVPALVALDGRWSLLRAELGTVLLYGLVAVTGCQLAYFNAVQHMEVGPALLIEYTAPVAILGWVWLRHHQRPGRLTVVGALVAAAGLVLVLDVVSGAAVSVSGVLWALAAMVGVAFYFVISAGESALPPVVLAAAGLVVGAVALLAAGLVGVVDLSGSTAEVHYAVGGVPFWVPLLALGVVSSAVAYVSGIRASRRLGSRLASFVALLEVLFALVFAWILLRELPNTVQFTGAGFVLVGVVLVKIAENGNVRLPVVPEPDALVEIDR